MVIKSYIHPLCALLCQTPLIKKQEKEEEKKKEFNFNFNFNVNLIDWVSIKIDNGIMVYSS